MRTIFLALTIFRVCGTLTAQDPSIEWSRNYGGTSFDQSYSVFETLDGGYVVAGVSLSNDGDVANSHGYYDAWILKLSVLGDIEWSKTYGGSDYDGAANIVQLSNNGYLFSATTKSSDGDVSGFQGYWDIWVVKVDSLGSIEWQKCLGGSDMDVASKLLIDSDTSFVLVGYTISDDGDINENHGASDAVLMKLNNKGDLLWTRTYGGTGIDHAVSVIKTFDNGYAIAALTVDESGDVAGCNFHDFNDIWVLKLDSVGNIEWSQCYGGYANELPNEIIQTPEGDFVICGLSNSDDGDVTGNHGDWDYWIFKIDATGNLIWQKSLGGTGDDRCFSVKLISDQKLIAAGYTLSDDGDISFNHGEYNDGWIVILDQFGNLEWEHSYGGSQGDGVFSLIRSSDGGYILAGSSLSEDGDLNSTFGGADYWVVKLSATTHLENDFSFANIFVYPSPSTGLIYIDAGTNSVISIEVHDILGREVYSRNYLPNQKLIIDLQHFASGVYFLNLSVANERISKKIIIK